MLQGTSEETLLAVLREHLTTSDHITTPEKLFGRDKLLQRIRRAFNSRGRMVFIYGDRGVGKSSLALTAAHIQHTASSKPIHVNCGESSTFESVIHAIGHAAVSVVERFESAGTPPGFGGQVLGTGFNYSPGSAGAASLP